MAAWQRISPLCSHHACTRARWWWKWSRDRKQQGRITRAPEETTARPAPTHGSLHVKGTPIDRVVQLKYLGRVLTQSGNIHVLKNTLWLFLRQVLLYFIFFSIKNKTICRKRLFIDNKISLRPLYYHKENCHIKKKNNWRTVSKSS